MAQDTKTRILDAAELLFARDGFAATSMRRVTAEADVNLAAVNYHFGTKETLLFEVLARRVCPINAERLRRLDAMERMPGRPGVEQLVRAFVEPPFQAFAEAGERGAAFVRLIARTHSETSRSIQERFLDLFREVMQRFAQAFSRALPQLPPEVTAARMYFLVGCMAHTLVHEEKLTRLLEHVHSRVDVDWVQERLVRFASVGMSAPHEDG